MSLLLGQSSFEEIAKRKRIFLRGQVLKVWTSKVGSITEVKKHLKNNILPAILGTT